MGYNVSDLEKWNEKIEEAAKEYGLDYYTQEFEIIGYNEMLSHEAYTGMPSRYPHWSFGKSYEKNKTLYSLNLTGLPYEMVINSDPCIAYLMRDNTLLLQILTMAHVYGHNDFFKNNRLFVEGTRAKSTVEMFKLGADTIRGYINDPSIGYEEVERVVDAAHSIRYQVSRVAGEKDISQDEIRDGLLKEYMEKLQKRDDLNFNDPIEKPDLTKFPLEPEDDLMKFIIKYGQLEEWEKSILEIVRREMLYFIPQIETKIMNEGWASYSHYNILKSLNLSQELHFEFLKRHNDVIASMPGRLNPYYIGFKIFEYLDKNYGKDRIFQVRKMDRDNSFLRRYLTEDLCRELNLFEYVKSGRDYLVSEVSDENGWKKIRDSLADSTGIGTIPYIRVKDLNLKTYTLTLEHVYNGRTLDRIYARETLKKLYDLWKHKIKLLTKDKEGNELTFICEGKDKITM
ncbi:SpoVR family protein [Inconstantimicrobium mannanitabidum]|uniref:Stage V sporulation protein R n=1 Tax=Inconstantimicrobium mannanitabidum TaxID=1604901 RepID=A0ACB5REQ8_9CLOT|nr:SpoVR family protein [Clostridium sp. TW13]GKX67758.1 stage V sporulation protein R [Clostridium sp. TW13]